MGHFWRFWLPGVPRIVHRGSKITQNGPKSSEIKEDSVNFWGHGVFGKDRANHFGEIGKFLILIIFGEFSMIRFGAARGSRAH